MMQHAPVHLSERTRVVPRPAPPPGVIELVGWTPTLSSRGLSGGAGQLPSSESVNAVLRGQDGGWAKVVTSTALRAVLIAPGMAFAGARGWRLVGASMLGSATITAFLFVFYGLQQD